MQPGRGEIDEEGDLDRARRCHRLLLGEDFNA
jgi:hypothetical protein